MRAIAAWDKGLYSLASRQLWHIDQVSHRKTQPIQMTQQLRGRALRRGRFLNRHSGTNPAVTVADYYAVNYTRRGVSTAENRLVPAEMDIRLG